MLSRVAPGQVRFALPGLVADARGVALGRELLGRFLTLDRLVGFLRLLTAEQRLDDLADGFRLMFARAEGAVGREVMARLPATSSDFAELVARVVRTAGGSCLTGSGRHFVPFRDGRAALGYDVTQVAGSDGDLLIYGEDAVVPYRLEGELSIERLLLRLPLVREPGRPKGLAREEAPALAYATVRQGLAPVLLSYLSRSGTRAAAAPCEGAPGALGETDRFWMFRVEHPTARVWALLSRTPGVRLYLPVGRRAAVALGHRHPVHLDACEATLAGGAGAERFILFDPPPGAPIVLSPPPALMAVDDLVRLVVPRVDEAKVGPSSPARPATRQPLETPLRLVRTPEIAGPVSAALVPWERLRWLERLCYALPAPALRTHRAAFLDDGVLVVSSDGVEGFPFAALFGFVAPGVLVPVGYSVAPAASPALLVERLGTGDGSVVLLRPGGVAPLRVPVAAFAALERRTLARLAEEIRPAKPALVPTVPPPATPEVAMDPLGFMPLWGLSGGGRSR